MCPFLIPVMARLNNNRAVRLLSDLYLKSRKKSWNMTASFSKIEPNLIVKNSNNLLGRTRCSKPNHRSNNVRIPRGAINCSQVCLPLATNLVSEDKKKHYLIKMVHFLSVMGHNISLNKLFKITRIYRARLFSSSRIISYLWTKSKITLTTNLKTKV